MLTLSDFDFELPTELIASRPLAQRDASRMLVVNGHDVFDKHIRDFLDFLQPGDMVLMMGAGNIWQCSIQLVDDLKQKQK